MYAHTVKPVPMPVTGGKAKIYKSGYVYWITKSHWDNHKKVTIDDRTCIGKSVPDDPKMIYPNERFFKIFELPGTNSANDRSRDRGKFSVVLNYGVFHSLLQACKLCGCHKSLVGAFGDEDCKKIIAIACHAIDSQCSVAQDFPDWSFHNYCGLSRPLSDGQISTMYSKIASEPEAVASFMSSFQHAFFQIFSDGQRRAVGLDSTNQNTCSSNLSTAEFGHAKTDEGLPIINTALFVDEKTGIPLYYEHFCGSILDKTQTPLTLKKAKDIGFNHLFLMMDRGYMSKENLKALRQEQFGIMCPGGLKLSENLILQYRLTIKDQEEHYISSENIYGIHIKDVKYDDFSYDAYVYYDPQRAQDEKDSIHSRLLFFKAGLLKKKRYSDKLKTFAAPWFIISKSASKDDEGRNFSCVPNQPEVQSKIDTAGFFVILSNAGLSAEQMIKIARLRDTDEKAFKRLKYHLGLTKTYAHSPKTYEGKMFVAFVALIMIEAFRYYQRPVLHAKTSETVATVLGELRKYQIRLKQDGRWMPQYAVTAKQKTILKEIGSSASILEDEVNNVFLRV